MSDHCKQSADEPSREHRVSLHPRTFERSREGLRKMEQAKGQDNPERRRPPANNQ